MKKNIKYTLLIVLIFATSIFTWWQYSKQNVVKNKIQNALIKATDSAYFIHYDSSNIDEIKGDANFYNIVLQTDSVQKITIKNYENDKPKIIININVVKLSIAGINVHSFLNKNTITAKKIEILKPIITIIQTGEAETIKLTAADTLALYKKLIGKFKSIKADVIKIIDASVIFKNDKQIPQTTLEGINIFLTNLLIDSTKKYDNIISYFIKDVVASVKNIVIKNNSSSKILRFENTLYDASKKLLLIDKIYQIDTTTNKKLMMLTKNKIAGISTDAFIIKKQLKADSLSTDGGELIILKKKNSTNKIQTIEIENDFFDEALIRNINVGSTNISIYNYDKKNEMPILLKNVKFKAININNIYSGTNIMRLINNSNWKLIGDGTSFYTLDKMYNINIGGFVIDNKNSKTSIKNITVLPVLNEPDFAKQLSVQKDRYNLHLNKISITNFDFKKLITNNTIIAEAISLSPIFNIYNDKTVKEDQTSKIGKYPQQIIQKLSTKIHIKKITLNNGYINYKEKGEISKKIGQVYFNNITGSISNFTNIEQYIKSNNIMTVSVSCKFLNTAALTTKWLLPLSSYDGTFSVTGKVSAFNATNLNPVTESLGLASIKSGYINSYNFSINGNDLKAIGNATLLYQNLKITLLKKIDGESNLKKRNTLSTLANTFIKNSNPTNGIIRKGDMAFTRVMNKSFFNLVFKSILAGAKTSIK